MSTIDPTPFEHNDQSLAIRSKPSRIWGLLFWGSLVLLVLMVIAFLFPDPDAETSSSSYLWSFSMIGLWSVFTFNMWSVSYWTATLVGPQLTLTRGKYRKKTWSIDITRVHGVSAKLFTSNRGLSHKTYAVLTLVTDDDKRINFTLSPYRQVDRDLFMPVVAEIIHRPGMTLQGELEGVLRSWFGEKLTVPAGTIDPEITLPSVPFREAYGAFGVACIVFAVLLLPIYAGGQIVTSLANERVLDQRGVDTTATVEHTLHSRRAGSAYTLGLAYTDAQSKKVESYVYVTEPYFARTALGDKVPVTYDPQDSQVARLGDPAYARPYWRAVVDKIILFLVCAAVLIGGAYSYVFLQKKKGQQSTPA